MLSYVISDFSKYITQKPVKKVHFMFNLKFFAILISVTVVCNHSVYFFACSVSSFFRNLKKDHMSFKNPVLRTRHLSVMGVHYTVIMLHGYRVLFT